MVPGEPKRYPGRYIMRNQPLSKRSAPNRIPRSGAFLVYALLAGAPATSQSPEMVGGGGSVPLRQAIKDANSDLHVAIVAAHPDDRYVLPAAYLRNLRGYRVSIVLFTRGEGGQNSRGPEIGDALGRLRTEETEDGARRLGTKVWYLNREDGGYCRTAEEALDLWGEESTTQDLARLFRKIEPDIILTTHSPDESHGHDQGLLKVLPRAVELASNPTFVTANLPALRLPYLFRGADRSKVNEPVEKTILPMDVIDVSRGNTIRHIAYNALTGAHLSQSPFKPIEELFAPEIGLVGVSVGGKAALSLDSACAESRTMFDALKEGARDSKRNARGEKSIMSSADRVALREKLESLPNQLNDRRKLVTTALALRRQLRTIPRAENTDLDRRIKTRIEALDRVILHGLSLQASIQRNRNTSAVPGEVLPFSLSIHNGPLARIEALELRALSGGSLQDANNSAVERAALNTDESWRASVKFKVSSDMNIEEETRRLYNGDTTRRPIELAIRFRVKLGDPQAPGEVLEFPINPLVRVCDPIELEVNPTSLLILNNQDSVRFSVRIRRNTQEPIDGRIQILTQAGLRVIPNYSPVQMSDARVRDHLFELKVNDLPPSTVQIRVKLNDARIRVGVFRVDANVRKGLRVGIIRGADNTSYHLLRSMQSAGIELVMLGESDLPTRDLSDLDTIVIDIRALRHHEAARASMNRLLNFAESGGRLLIFYHKDTEFNVESTGFRAYPRGLSLTIGKNRVTHHDAPVTVLIPDHHLLNSPNKIQASDWDGWVQERGLYFPTKYGDGFEELLSMADPNRPAQKSSLLYSRVDKGEYIYCALSLYRQLKQNPRPGASRLFVNLISHQRPQNR